MHYLAVTIPLASSAATTVALETESCAASTRVGLPRVITRTRCVPAALSSARMPRTVVSAAIEAVAASFRTVPAGRAPATVTATVSNSTL